MLPLACSNDENTGGLDANIPQDVQRVYLPEDTIIDPESTMHEPVSYETLEMVEIESLPLGIADGTSFDPVDEAISGFENVAQSVNRYLPFKVATSQVINLDSSSLDRIPVLLISAKGTFRLTAQESKNLRLYIQNGGFVIIDNPEPEKLQSESSESLRNIILDALGDQVKFYPIPHYSMIYHVFFDFMEGSPGGEDILVAQETGNHDYYRPYIEGVWLDSRLVAVFSDRGYIYRWAEEKSAEIQRRFAVNIVLFGLFQKGSLLQQWSQQQNQ